MTILAVVITIFALFAWSRVFLRWHEGKNTWKECVLWSAIWVSTIITVWIPKTAEYITDRLGVDRPVDAMIYISVLALLYLVYRLYVKLNNTEQEITKIVREIALRKK